MSDPHEWHIGSDREGFFIVDEYGEEVNPPWLDWPGSQWRCQSFATAECVLKDAIQHALDNYEPPSPPGWEGRFAENH